MNKTKIEWADYTWNPVTGCLHNCPYCYAKKMDKRFGDGNFTPTFHYSRLQEPVKVRTPSKIFVGSVSDLFGEWAWKDSSPYSDAKYHRNEVIRHIFDVVKQCPQHTFIFLTKNPKGMQGINFPDNCWCGTSVENQEKADERIPELLAVDCKTLFVSYEPALGAIDFTELRVPDTQYFKFNVLTDTDDEHYHNIHRKIDWLIIGAQTGQGAIKPKHEWITSAVRQAAEAGIPIFLKDNLEIAGVIREYPGGD